MTRLRVRAVLGATMLFGLASAAFVPSISHALGINCRGSSFCATTSPAAELLSNFIQDQIDPNRFYANGEHIACGSFQGPTQLCVFLQNTGGAFGSQIRPLIHFIPDHGCRACGSVPTDFPSSNDVSHGQLTINFVQGNANCGNGELRMCP